MADESFREIQLSGKQLIALFMTAAVVLIATFLAGVQVGRGVRLQREPASATDAAQAGGAAVDPTATPTAGKAAPPAEPQAQATPPAVPPPPTDDAPADGRTPAKPASAPAATAAPPPVNAEAKPAAPASQAVPVATDPAGAGYFLKVVAYREKGQADRMMARLTAKGYSAYVTPVAGKGATLFSVRVGKYATRKDADTVRQRLEQEEQLKPSIAR